MMKTQTTMKPAEEWKTIFEGITFCEGSDELLRFIRAIQKDALQSNSLRPLPEGTPSLKQQAEPVDAQERGGFDLWQPIDTAPRDETWIRVLMPDGQEDIAQWVNYKSGPIYGEWNAQEGNVYTEPTHWMPIKAQKGE